MSLKDDFLVKIDTIIESNLTNDKFGVSTLAKEMGMSRSTLHRKLQAYVGQSISEYIRNYRLKKAMKLLVDEDMNASEVSYAVGFGSASYFSRCFSEYYGQPPSRAKEIVVSQNKDLQRKISYFNIPRGQAWGIVSGLVVIAMVIMWWVHANSGRIAKASQGAVLPKTVFVMPFENLENDEASQYLVDGLRKSLIRNLLGVQGLDIVSDYAFKPGLKRNDVLNDLGNNFENSYLLTGGFEGLSPKPKLEVTIIDAQKKTQVWSRNYSWEKQKFTQLEGQLALDIAAQLGTPISAADMDFVNHRNKYVPEAYEAFLKGEYYFDLYTWEGLQKAPKFYEEAVALDPTMPYGYMGLSACALALSSATVAQLSMEEAMVRAEPLIKKALSLEPDNAYAQGYNAFITLYHHHDFLKAEQQYIKSLASNEPMMYYLLTELYLMENRWEEALQLSRLMDEKFPYQSSLITVHALYFNNKIEEAQEYIDQKLELHPTHYPSLESAGFFYLNTGQYKKAVHLFKRAMSVATRSPRALGWMGSCYVHMGNLEEVKAIEAELRARKDTTNAGAPAFYLGLINTTLGNYQESLDWLELAIKDREMEVPWLVSDPQLYPLHGHPRFDSLVKKIGFPDYAYPIKK